MLIRDQADRDAISSQLMRYRDKRDRTREGDRPMQRVDETEPFFRVQLRQHRVRVVRIVHEIPDRHRQTLRLRGVAIIEGRARLSEVRNLLLEVLPESVGPLLALRYHAALAPSSSSRPSAIFSSIRGNRCPFVSIVTSVVQAATGDTLGDSPPVLTFSVPLHPDLTP